MADERHMRIYGPTVRWSRLKAGHLGGAVSRWPRRGWGERTRVSSRRPSCHACRM